ncbi:MAG: hypothetical protein JEZ02_00905 [Desulfatibacillum sp.]|nr:hypothetical protein [Desulfatibacillum sp.]
MNFRSFFFTFSLFWLGTGLMLGAGSLTEALRQAFDPYSIQWLGTQAGWLFCLCLGPLLWAGLVRPSHSQQKAGTGSALILAVCLCLGPWVLKLAHGLYARPGGATWAGLTLILGLAPAFLAAGTMPVFLSGPLKNDPRMPGKILAPCFAGGALAAWAAPSYVYTLMGINTTLVVSGILSGMACLGAIFFRPSQSQAPYPESCSGSRLSRFAHVYVGACGMLLSILFLWTIRYFVPLVDGYLPALWLVPMVACIGLSLGAIFYLWKPRAEGATPTAPGLALLFFAVYVGALFTAGDSSAMLVALLRPLGSLGLSGNLLAWLAYPLTIAFWPCFALGYCLPAFSALHSRPGRSLFSWVAGGVLAGFIVFNLLIFFGPGTALNLRFTGLLAILLFLLLSFPPSAKTGRAFALVASVLAMAALAFPGPGPVWKHGGIGAGGMDLTGLDKNEVRDLTNGIRRGLVWETESSQGFVGLDSRTGPTVIINGDARTPARHEEFTRGMLGLLGPLLQPKAQSALVLGFKSGQTPAWLALADAIKSIQVACDIKAAQAMVLNLEALPGQVFGHPKIQFIDQGPLEAAFCSKNTYDLIISAPAQTHVSGMSRLYSPAFFQAVSKRMNSHALFIQHIHLDCWDVLSLSTLYGSLTTAFGSVQTWMLGPNDLALVCSREIKPLNMERLSATIQTEPFKTRLTKAWSVTDAEGVLARFIASDKLARTAGFKALSRNWANTRNQPSLEAGFSRAWARPSGLKITDIYNTACLNRAHRPVLADPFPDWEKVDHNRLLIFFLGEQKVPELQGLSPLNERRRESYNTLMDWNLSLFYTRQERYFRDSPYPLDIFISATALAENGSPLALKQARRLEALWPAAAQICEAWYYWRVGETQNALHRLSASLVRMQNDPLAHPLEIQAALDLSTKLSKEGAVYAKNMSPVLEVSFAGNAMEETRLQALFYAAFTQGPGKGAESLKAFEPYVPWNLEFLKNRLTCYGFTADPLLDKAAGDLRKFKYWSP